VGTVVLVLVLVLVLVGGGGGLQTGRLALQAAMLPKGFLDGCSVRR
jgi:hypothetical protein